MDNRLITMSTAPNNLPPLTPNPVLQQCQHNPAAGSAGFRYLGIGRERTVVVPSLAYPATWFFFFNETIITILQFSMYMLLRRWKRSQMVSEGGAEGI